MASVKIILRTKPNKDGTFSLALQFTKDRRKSISHLPGCQVKKEDWDAAKQRVKKSHSNSARINNLLIKKLAEASDKMLEAETHKKDTSAQMMRHSFKGKTQGTFFVQAETFLDSLKKAGKYNQYTSDKPRIKHFRTFIQATGAQDIAFSDITPTLLERFRGYVRGKLQLSERSAVNNLVTIRSVFSYAIKENLVDPKHYPFGKGKVKIKFPDSIKVGLTMEEIQQLEQVELIDPKLDHARNLFLVSFYFAGMRVSDVLRLKWRDIQDNRLHYAMGKNNKGGSLKIPDKAAKILDMYKQFKQNKNGLIFPDLTECDLDDKFYTQRRIAFRVSAIDKCLRLHIAPKAGIDKKLTMHIARHSFGNISGDRIPIQMLQKLYRHSSITTTIGYQQNFINQDTDAALDLVIGS